MYMGPKKSSLVRTCTAALLGLSALAATADGATRLAFSEPAVRARVSEAGRLAAAPSDVRPAGRVVSPSPSAN